MLKEAGKTLWKLPGGWCIEKEIGGGEEGFFFFVQILWVWNMWCLWSLFSLKILSKMCCVVVFGGYDQHWLCLKRFTKGRKEIIKGNPVTWCQVKYNDYTEDWKEL